MKPIYGGRTIPLKMFQHEWLSVSDRMLLVYSTFADETGKTTISTRNIAVLIGLVGEDGEPTKSDIVQLRNARALLVKKGHLVHSTEARKHRRHLDVYTLKGKAVSKEAMDLWNGIGSRQRTPCEYKDAGWGSPATAPPKVKIDVEDGYDLEDLLGEAGTLDAEEDEVDLDDLDDLVGGGT